MLDKNSLRANRGCGLEELIFKGAIQISNYGVIVVESDEKAPLVPGSFSASTLNRDVQSLVLSYLSKPG
jgi:hypothetical protein